MMARLRTGHELAAAVEKAEARLRAASEESAAAAEAQQRAEQAAAGGEEQQDGTGSGRQAIVWSGSGSSSRPGASRMELAIKREELMAHKLSEAEAAAGRHEEAIGRLEEARGHTLITVSEAEQRQNRGRAVTTNLGTPSLNS